MRVLKQTLVLGEETPAALLVEVDSSTRDGIKVAIGGQSRSLPALQVERVAAQLARHRADAGDYRRVCPDHGYHAESACPACSPVASR